MIDKQKIAQSFSRSASTYDSVAYFQREVGERLLSLMTEIKKESVECCVDLGCGTGHFQSALQTTFSQAQYVGFDLAQGMLSQVKNKQDGSHPNPFLVCGDAENLPFADRSAGLIFSNLALQWCENLSAVFSEANRVLKKDGHLCLTTLGPKTLFELKQAWAEVDNHQHVNSFYSQQQWQQAIREQGFVIEKQIVKNEVLYFSELKQLTTELKKLGAHNMNAGQTKTMTGRQQWRAFTQAYDVFLTETKRLPASYEVYYWVLQKND